MSDEENGEIAFDVVDPRDAAGLAALADGRAVVLEPVAEIGNDLVICRRRVFADDKAAEDFLVESQREFIQLRENVQRIGRAVARMEQAKRAKMGDSTP